MSLRYRQAACLAISGSSLTVLNGVTCYSMRQLDLHKDLHAGELTPILSIKSLRMSLDP
jgi:hypothetical protein